MLQIINTIKQDTDLIDGFRRFYSLFLFLEEVRGREGKRRERRRGKRKRGKRRRGRRKGGIGRRRRLRRHGSIGEISTSSGT